MKLKQLETFLFQSDLRDPLRIEVLDWYECATDDRHCARWKNGDATRVDEPRPAWLNPIRRDTNAVPGIAWRRVHIVTEPLTDYLLFECVEQYTRKDQAGEEIRVLQCRLPTARTTRIASRRTESGLLLAPTALSDDSKILVSLPFTTQSSRDPLESSMDRSSVRGWSTIPVCLGPTATFSIGEDNRSSDIHAAPCRD